MTDNTVTHLSCRLCFVIVFCAIAALIYFRPICLSLVL